MKIEILPTALEVAARGADLLMQAVSTNPRIVAALPTGRTPIQMYELLAARRRAGRFDLGEATTFNLDEILLPRAHPQTFYQFMTRYVWDPLGVASTRRFIPDGETVDPVGECLRYEAAIEKAGGLELAIVGIGADGHIAYNLPGQTKSRTHVVTLDDRTVRTLGGNLADPVRGITMGVETLLSARRILLLATGASKAEALRRMRDDEVSTAWPCTFFRDHEDLTLVADAPASAQL